MQAVLLNPEICIVVVNRITPEQRSQSRRIDPAEGSSPRSVMASKRDTTGILEQGMHTKGQLGNLREPDVSMLKSRADTG